MRTPARPVAGAAGRRSPVLPYPRLAAAWNWRLLLVDVVLYLVVTILAGLALVTVPVVLALLLAALLHRPARFLRRWLPSSLAALGVPTSSVKANGLTR
ncbi:hypothetical protein [Geodermatophilus sp. TF02-6]|uniref:hypothetical protein n=1 Tax=Geodermatophilus sp. TF02-6 TaxID=2250575 RepID=UPI0018F4CB71|nr:hypothetical protein [Geodermatophilus sp. TF02-6]